MRTGRAVRMTSGKNRDGAGQTRDAEGRDAKGREAERAALREARLGEALRANLKRRKDQARGRGAASPPAAAEGVAEPEPPDGGP